MTICPALRIRIILALLAGIASFVFLFLDLPLLAIFCGVLATMTTMFNFSHDKTRQPSTWAICKAQQIYSVMLDRGLFPKGLYPSAARGVIIVCEDDNERYASFEVFNDGGLLVALKTNKESDVFGVEDSDVAIVAAVDRLIEFVSRGKK